MSGAPELAGLTEMTVMAATGPVDGFAYDDQYVRLFWLPILGPTAYLTYVGLCEAPDGPVSLDQFAMNLGVSGKTTHGRITHSVKRIRDYGFVSWHSAGVLVVPHRCRALSAKLTLRLYPELAKRHDLWIDTAISQLVTP